MKGVECHLSSSLQLLWQEEGRGQEGRVSSITLLTITLAGGRGDAFFLHASDSIFSRRGGGLWSRYH